MVVHIIAGGSSDGVLSAAVVLRDVEEALVTYPDSFTARGLMKDCTVSSGDNIFLLGISLDRNELGVLSTILQGEPSNVSQLYENHYDSLGIPRTFFTDINLEYNTSCCEQIYNDLGSTLDIMIPAIASLNEGYSHTPLVTAAQEKHGERLQFNADLVMYALLGNMLDIKIKRLLSANIAQGKLPDEIKGISDVSARGVSILSGLRRFMVEGSYSMNNLIFTAVPELPIGFARPFLDELAVTNGKTVAAGILTDRQQSKLTIISKNPYIDIAQLTRDVELPKVNHRGGNLTRANVILPALDVQSFFESLDSAIASYSSTNST